MNSNPSAQSESFNSLIERYGLAEFIDLCPNTYEIVESGISDSSIHVAIDLRKA
ncbi:hypothetical protein KPL47_21795 [Clostridium estertheticum]|uniref:hypothetical protein n=1 Tax=Clostridium estertheticum TaxID=238834 RepID=UPI001C0E1743|nr:hypothetical protein [Clostridium estertheticum]MBU3178945.1 hypothetical protein [Clostridium estertheticum]